jgi:diguanylate cyclase (GGDEF)-like protein
MGVAPLDIGVVASLVFMAKTTEALDLFHVVFLLIAVEAFFLGRWSFWPRVTVALAITEVLIIRAGDPPWQDIAEPMVLATIAALVLIMHDSREGIRAKLREQARRDPLTGLLNRRALQTNLVAAAAQRGSEPFAVLYVDLDGFKGVNDTHGHDVGDTLLSLMARRIETVMRSGDDVGRIGGDEFAVVLPGAEREIAEDVARRLLSQFETPFKVGEHSITISASIGIAMSAAGDGETPRELLRRADRAMYTVKRADKGDYIFAPEPSASP